MTEPTPAAALRTMRIVHRIFAMAIFVYAYLAEVQFQVAGNPMASFVVSISFLVVAEIGLGAFLRKKRLNPALAALRVSPADSTALGQWRGANILSLVFAFTVGLFGFALRFLGSSRAVTVPFFILSLLLMLYWRPYLPEATDDTKSTGRRPN